MKVLQRILRALSWGGATGLAALALDELTVFLTLGSAIPLRPRFAVAYVGAGAGVAVVVEAALAALGKPRPKALRIAGVTLGAIYAASVFERVYQAVELEVAAPVAFAAAALAAGGYALWVAILRRVAGGEGEAALTRALLLAAVAVSLGLAVNRNLVNRALEPAALLADAAVLAVGLALAATVRLAGPRRAAAAAGTLAAAAILVVLTQPWHRPPAPGGGPRRHPHLVLVVIDTLRLDVFRSVVDGSEEGHAFRAALGPAAWFDGLIAAAPWTAPSVATIMTGLYPPEHGFGTARLRKSGRPLRRLSRSATTLAQSLGVAGYRTVGIVTNPLLHPVSGIGRGFQDYELLGGPTTKLPLLTVLARVGCIRREFYQGAGAVRQRLERRLGDLSDGSPVFLWLHLMDPHYPLHRHRDLLPLPDAEALPRDERLYRDETRYALAEVVRMMEMLKTHGLWDDACFVLLSDHGEMFPSDGHVAPGAPKVYGHGHALYGELMRVPLVIRPPGGLGSERRIGVLASQADLHDTIADLLGLDLPRIAGDRVSLAPWLGPELPAAGAPRRAYALIGANQVGPPLRGVRTETRKLIQYPEDPFPDELYDLSADPGEHHDLAHAASEQLAELRELLTVTWSRLDLVDDDSGPVEFDDETRQRLKALGYLQ